MNSNDTAMVALNMIADLCYNASGNVRKSAELCFMTSLNQSKSLPPTTLYPLTFIYIFILMVGFVGNLLTCVVIVKHRSLRTMTNQYLFNMAIADLITICFGLPFELYLMYEQYPWNLPDVFCHLKGYITEVTSYVSVLTILAFSVERYMAICHSLSAMASKFKKVWAVILLIWIIAALSALPLGVHHRADYMFPSWYGSTVHFEGPIYESRMCMLAVAFNPNLAYDFLIIFHVSALFYFVLPLFVIGFLYYKIARAILNSKVWLKQQRPPLGSVQRSDVYSTKLMIILFSVVISFFACYFPYQLQRLLFFYISDQNLLIALNQYLYFISGIMFYLSSVLNPVLYNVMSTAYRRAFREVLCCKPQTSLGLVTGTDRPSQCQRLSPRYQQNSIIIAHSSPSSVASSRRTRMAKEGQYVKNGQSWNGPAETGTHPVLQSMTSLSVKKGDSYAGSFVSTNGSSQVVDL